MRKLFALAAKTVLACVAVIIAFNWLVDPLMRFHAPWFGAYVPETREMKDWMIRDYDHDALLLGASRTAFIHTADIDDPYRFFNGSFYGATVEEIYFFLARHPSPKRKLILVGLDLYSFDGEPSVTEQAFLHTSAKDKALYLLATGTAVQGFHVLQGRLNGIPPTWLASGGWAPDMKRSTAPFTKQDVSRAAERVWNQTYASFALSNGRFDYMRRLRGLLETDAEDYVVFLNPEDDVMMERIRARGLYPKLQEVRARLRGIFGSHFVDYSESAFSGADNFRLPHDVGHYYPSVGAAIVKDVLARTAARHLPNTTPDRR